MSLCIDLGWLKRFISHERVMNLFTMSLDQAVLIIQSLIHEPQASLLAGILFGTKASFSQDLINALIISGTIHIAALSGQNIAVLSGFIHIALLRFVSRLVSGLLTILIIIGFILFVGPSPSIVRAGIMGSIGLIGVMFGRQRWTLFIWLVTMTIMLIIQSKWITDVGFQLSALGSLGLILFGPEIRSSKKDSGVVKKCTSFLREELHLTLAAQVLTLPILFFQFHRISLVAPVSNILIGWILSPMIVLGLLMVFLGFLSLALATPLSWVLHFMTSYILSVVEITSKIPFSSVQW